MVEASPGPWAAAWMPAPGLAQVAAGQHPGPVAFLEAAAAPPLGALAEAARPAQPSARWRLPNSKVSTYAWDSAAGAAARAPGRCLAACWEAVRWQRRRAGAPQGWGLRLGLSSSLAGR